MLISRFNRIRIDGITVAVPPDKVPVESFYEAFGEENVEKISAMTGVRTMHRARPEQTAGDLGFVAARDLMQHRKIDPAGITALVFVTQKPDFRVPSTAFLVHKRLGLSRECVCFDLNLACSGYVYGLQLLCSILNTMPHGKALLVTGDTSSRTISPLDRSMIMLFGDSGTATLLEKVADGDPMVFTGRTDGGRFKSIITPAGGYRNRGMPKEREEWPDGITRSDYDTHMKGMEVFEFSITDVPQLVADFLQELGTNADTYDCFALHQANIYILKQIARKNKIPKDKMPVSMDRFGNNSMNSIPLLLADHFGANEGGPMRVLMCGFGGGLSWAAADVIVPQSHVFPIIYSDEGYAAE